MKTYATIKGIEVMWGLRKGQASSFYYVDPLVEICLLKRVFEIQVFITSKGCLIVNFATVPPQALAYLSKENGTKNPY